MCPERCGCVFVLGTDRFCRGRSSGGLLDRSYLEVWEVFFALALCGSHTDYFQAPENEEFDLKLEGLKLQRVSKFVHTLSAEREPIR